MLTVGGAEAVLVVVGLVVRRAGVETAVVALLQLDRVGAGQLGLAEQLARLLEAALVVVTDLRDHIARACGRRSRACRSDLAMCPWPLGCS